MNPVEKSSINALAEAIKSAENPEKNIGGLTAADFINAFAAESDEKKRRKMAKEFYNQRKNMAEVLKNFEDVFAAEAEMALLRAAIGGEKSAPNVNALKFLLKNKMPGKYSDKPVGDTEVEDVSEIEEDLYGDKG